MSRFLDQIRKAKEARLAAARQGRDAPPAQDGKTPGEEKPLVPEAASPGRETIGAPPPSQPLFPKELEKRKPAQPEPEKPAETRTLFPEKPAAAREPVLEKKPQEKTEQPLLVPEPAEPAPVPEWKAPAPDTIKEVLSPVVEPSVVWPEETEMLRAAREKNNVPLEKETPWAEKQHASPETPSAEKPPAPIFPGKVPAVQTPAMPPAQPVFLPPQPVAANPTPPDSQPPEPKIMHPAPPVPKMEKPPAQPEASPRTESETGKDASALRPPALFRVASVPLPRRKSEPEPEPEPEVPEKEPILFPHELEDQGLPFEEKETHKEQEPMVFIPGEKDSKARGTAGRRRLRQFSEQISIPGPEPDPAFLNRIVRVAPQPDKRILSFHDPKHHICEEYRLLGKNLLHAFSNGQENPRRGKVVALTSSIRGEGKTLTSMNLAQTLAEDLKDRVLLLDGDMRHPKVHRYIGLPLNAGLNDLLACSDPEAALEDCLVRTDTGLHLLMAKTSRGNPAPLLDSPNMARILNLLRDRYSLIIIDTPPVLLATDGLILGSRSDGMLFLLRARKTKREQIQEARQRIARLEIRLLGYVINNVKTFLPKIWSRYYYGNY